MLSSDIRTFLAAKSLTTDSNKFNHRKMVTKLSDLFEVNYIVSSFNFYVMCSTSDAIFSKNIDEKSNG